MKARHNPPPPFPPFGDRFTTCLVDQASYLKLLNICDGYFGLDMTKRRRQLPCQLNSYMSRAPLSQFARLARFFGGVYRERNGEKKWWLLCNLGHSQGHHSRTPLCCQFELSPPQPPTRRYLPTHAAPVGCQRLQPLLVDHSDAASRKSLGRGVRF